MVNHRRIIMTLCWAVFLSWTLTARAVERPTSEPNSCVTADCHNNYQNQPNVHGPVALGDCDSCHKSVDPQQHTYALVRQGRDLCEYCHLDQTSKQHVHDPLTTGDCQQCHDPHAGPNPQLLKAPTVAELCRKCHATGMDTEYVHGPVAVGQCTICHDPHSSDANDLLVKQPADLCLSCHVVTKEELSGFEFVHKPATDNCVGCHSPHGADNDKMLRDKAPHLCFTCHDDIKNIVDNAKVPHRIVLEGESCTACHTPHASSVQNLLKAAPMDLCLKCHSEPIMKDGKQIVASFAAEVDHKKYLHGPVADKNCQGCHMTHGSQHFRLLKEEYPAKFYAPFKEENYALCFSCHPDTLVLDERTEELTNFRNGDLNLHYVHVNKERRGRTCRACHATHASDLEKHIRHSVPYGAWELPIQFHKTDDGGGCAPGCHVPLEYNRVNPVAYDPNQVPIQQ